MVKGMNKTLVLGMKNLTIIKNVTEEVKAENIFNVPSNVECLITSVKGRK